MAAYAIFEVEMTDASWRDKYAKPTAALVARHGGRYIAASPELKRLEGSRKLPSVVVVIEFPSVEAAQAWYDDPEYRPLIALRQSSSTSEAVLVPGLA